MNKDHQIDNFVSLIKKLHKQQNYKSKSNNNHINKTIHQIQQQKSSLKYHNSWSQKYVKNKQPKLNKNNQQHNNSNQHDSRQVKSSRNYGGNNYHKNSKFYEDNQTQKNNPLAMCTQTNSPITAAPSPKIFKSSKQHKNQQIPTLSPKNTILQFLTPPRNKLKYKTQQLYNKQINQCLNTQGFLSTQTCKSIRNKTNISQLSLAKIQSGQISNIKKIRMSKYNKYCINLLNKYKDSYQENKVQQQKLRNTINNNNTDNIGDKNMNGKQVNDQNIVTKMQNINRIKIMNNKERLLSKFKNINVNNNNNTILSKFYTTQNDILNGFNVGEEKQYLQSKSIQNDKQKFEIKDKAIKTKTEKSALIDFQQKYAMKTKRPLQSQRTLPNSNSPKVVTITQQNPHHSHPNPNPQNNEYQNYHYTQKRQTGQSNMPLSHLKTKSRQRLENHTKTSFQKGQEANIKIQGWNVHNPSRNNNDIYVRNYCYDEGGIISRSESIYGRSLDLSY